MQSHLSYGDWSYPCFARVSDWDFLNYLDSFTQSKLFRFLHSKQTDFTRNGLRKTEIYWRGVILEIRLEIRRLRLSRGAKFPPNFSCHALSLVELIFISITLRLSPFCFFEDRRSKFEVRSSKFGPLTSVHSGFTKNKVRSPNNESNPSSVHLK